MNTRFLLFLFLLTFSLFSCKNNDVDAGDDSPYQQEGFVLASISLSTAGNSFYAGYYPELPSGNVDLTAKSTYPYFYPHVSWKNFLIGRPLLMDDKKLSKLAVLKTTGAIQEVASIPLVDQAIQTVIINDNLGVYSTGGNRGLFLFNPATMENLGQIDMTGAQNFPANESNIYAHLIYRPQDNRLFAPLLTNSSKTGAFYDSQNVYVEVINLTTRKWEKTAVFEQATYPVSRGMENGLVDESGNVYLITQGQYGLDGQLGPQSAKRSRPQILKIPAGGTDFDKTYSFNPVNAVGLPNLAFQLVLGGIYDANGIAYACISGQQDPPRLLELIGKLAANSITSAEFGELQNLAFYGANQRWVKLDLNAKTATIIQDIPLTAGFGYPVSYKYDGKFYFPAYNADQKLNGFYRYDPATSKATLANSLTAGGLITHLFKLTK